MQMVLKVVCVCGDELEAEVVLEDGQITIIVAFCQRCAKDLASFHEQRMIEILADRRYVIGNRCDETSWH